MNRRNFHATRCVGLARSGHAALGLLACGLIMAAAAGCRRGSDSTGSEQPLFPEIELPRVDEPPAELRQQMVGLDPDSAAFREHQFKLLVAWDKIRRHEGVEGYREVVPAKVAAENACVDQETGKVAFRSLVCWNPTCPGRGKGGGPPLFVKQWSSASAGKDGKVVWTPPPRPADPLQEDISQNFIRCPHCGQLNGVAYYDQPEVVLRRRQLEEELVAARAARRQARNSDPPSPMNHRTPSEVMREINELPKLFLVPEEAK